MDERETWEAGVSPCPWVGTTTLRPWWGVGVLLASYPMGWHGPKDTDKHPQGSLTAEGAHDGP